MKKSPKPSPAPRMKKEYDFSGGVRGKYAARFAEGKPIELIDGVALLAMIRAVQEPANTASRDQSRLPTPTADVPSCPKCGTTMVRRNNRRDGTQFWGCTRFPACRGTR